LYVNGSNILKTLLSLIVFMFFQESTKILWWLSETNMWFAIIIKLVQIVIRSRLSNDFVLVSVHDEDNRKKSQDVFISNFLCWVTIFFQLLCFWMTKKMFIFAWMKILVPNITERFTNWYVFKTNFFGMPHLATCMYLSYFSTMNQNWVQTFGMALTPFPSSVWHETRFEPTTFLIASRVH